MPTHVHGNSGDVAPYVLLPGDPNRSKYIAEAFLENPVMYTDYRGLFGYTGTYKGIRISVQTTGMGCPTTAIVLEELIQLGAKCVQRVGTCGALYDHLEPTDLVIAQASLPFDGTTRLYLGDGPMVPIPTWRVLEETVKAARAQNLKHHVGMISSGDAYYGPPWVREERLKRGAIKGNGFDAAALRLPEGQTQMLFANNAAAEYFEVAVEHWFGEVLAPGSRGT